MIRFIDGTEVPAEYLDRVTALINDAEASDPGEEHEPAPLPNPLADLYARRRAVGFHATAARLTDLEARVIASSWHGGAGSALYAFTSTGAIDTARDDHDMAAEVTDCARSCTGQQGPDFTDLIALRSYARRNGPRGPIAGWSRLSW